MKLLKLLMVTCTVCGQSTKIGQHRGHVTSNCSPVSISSSPDSSIEAILTKSGDTPLSCLENKLQTALVKRSLASSSKSTLQVKTGGQVRHILSGTHTHAHTHAHKHNTTHTYTRACTHTRTQTQHNTHIYTCMHTQIKIATHILANQYSTCLDCQRQ